MGLAGVPISRSASVEDLSFVRDVLTLDSRTDFGEKRSLGEKRSPESLGPREIGGRARVREERSDSDIRYFYIQK